MGYILLDVNTKEPSWDGVVYETEKEALAEIVQAYKDAHLSGEPEDRPDEYDEGDWYIVRVEEDPELDRKVLTACQEAWDKHQAWVSS